MVKQDEDDEIQNKIDNGYYNISSDEDAGNADSDMEVKIDDDINNDLMFATEIEAGYQKPNSQKSEVDERETVYVDEPKSKTQMEMNNDVVQNKLALVNLADKYLDMDQKITVNYEKSIKDRGWSREKRTAAKVPPMVLFGFNKRPDSHSTAARTNVGYTTIPTKSQVNLKAKSSMRRTTNPLQSQKSLKSRLNANFNAGLGFSQADIASMDIHNYDLNLGKI